MDLKYVRSELQKLSEIIDNWDTPQETATRAQIAVILMRYLTAEN